jgi:TIR domain-containing protein
VELERRGMGDETMSSADVVISYRREDVDAAGRLADWLADHFGGSRIFIDDQIRAGERFPAVIEEAISDCDVVVAVITAHWSDGLDNPDDWVRREIRAALAADKAVVPVLMHGIEPPAAQDLPEEMAPLAETQMISITARDYRDDVNELVEALQRHVPDVVPTTVLSNIPTRNRPEARAAWDAPGSIERVRERLETALAASSIDIDDESNGVLQLSGGNKWKARLLSGLTGPLERLPMKGYLRITDRSASVLIEVLLTEDWGTGILGGIAGRYETRFEKAIAALRDATARR